MQKDRSDKGPLFKVRRLTAALLFLLAAVMVVRATTGPTQTGPGFAVNTLADTDDGSCDLLGQGTGNHDCTLREAINAANAYGDGATIIFSLSGTIVVSSSLPQISVSMTLDGTGQSVVISGNDSVKPFSTIFAYWANHGPVNFNALTMAHGKGNGALEIYYTNVNITNCTFNDNNSTPSAGGAVRIDQGATAVVMANCTFYNNTATSGGGVYIQGVPNGAPSAVYIYNSTFYNNHASFGTGGFNLAAADIYASSATAEIRNTILVNTDNRGTNQEDNAQGLSYAETSDIFNVDIDSQSFNATPATAAQVNLDTLKNNGGPTNTIALLAGSVAINAGNSAVASVGPVNGVDERGYERFSSTDSSCDVGAYEYNSPGLRAPLPYWRRVQGLAADGSQDLANPSGDGISNLLKYAFNLAPNAGDLARSNTIVLTPNGAAGLPLITRDGQGRLVVEFVRRKSFTDPGIAYIVETGTTLPGLNLLDLTSASSTPIDATFERVTVTDPTVSTKRFGHVRVLTLPVYFNNFNTALGLATLYGNALWTNQAVQLTDSVASSAGSVIFNGISLGSYNRGFSTHFNLQIGPTTSGGVPADGVSFAVGALPASVWGEQGPGTSHSIAVGFDTYDNGGDGSIGIHLWINGVHVASNPINPYTNGALVPVEITYDASSGLTVKFNGTTVFNNVPIAGFSFLSTDQFGFGARTGGANERAIIDDVKIAPR